MRETILRFFRGEEAQDMVEYTLLLAFVVLAGAASYIGISNSIAGLWTSISGRLASD
jgi:Flp pilus assembly pilin Flp